MSSSPTKPTEPADDEKKKQDVAAEGIDTNMPDSSSTAADDKAEASASATATATATEDAAVEEAPSSAEKASESAASSEEEKALYSGVETTLSPPVTVEEPPSSEGKGEEAAPELEAETKEDEPKATEAKEAEPTEAEAEKTTAGASEAEAAESGKTTTSGTDASAAASSDDADADAAAAPTSTSPSPPPPPEKKKSFQTAAAEVGAAEVAKSDKPKKTPKEKAKAAAAVADLTSKPMPTSEPVVVAATEYPTLKETYDAAKKISPIFGPAVGPVLSSHPCKHRPVVDGGKRAYTHGGRMYVCTKALCFYSANYFGFETCRVVLPWRDAVRLEKFQDDAVKVFSMNAKVKGKEQEALFSNITLRDDAFNLMEKLREEVMEAESKKMKEKEEKKLNSGDGGGGKKEEEELHASVDIISSFLSSSGRAPSIHQSMQMRKSMAAQELLEEVEVVAKAKDEGGEKAAASASAAAASSSSPALTSVKEGVAMEATEEAAAIAPPAEAAESTAAEDDAAIAHAAAAVAQADTRSSTMILISEFERGGLFSPEGQRAAEKYGKMVPESMREAWVSVRDAKDPSYANVVVKGANLPCTLDEFYDFFLSDSSSHSVEDFQKTTQSDTEFETSSWSLSDQDAFSLTRTVRYVHPVNAPMAPPSAAATKEQLYRRFGNEGLVLETQTVVNDVPMADCFYVDDRLAVEPSPEGGVNMTLSFEVRFVKRTMFKKVIQSTSNSEVTKVLVDYEKYVRRSIREEEREKEARKKKKAEAEDAGGAGVSVEVNAEAGAEGEKAGPAAEVEERGGGTEAATKEKEDAVPAPSAAAAAEPATRATTTATPAATLPASPNAEMYLLILSGLVAVLVLFQFVSILQTRSTNRSLAALNESQERLAYLMREMLQAKGSEVQTCGAADS